MADLTGRIVFVPKGTPVTYEEDSPGREGRRPVKATRRDQWVVVQYDGEDHDHAEPVVAYATSGDLWRWVPKRYVVPGADERSHLPAVGRRRIVGGSPIKGGGNVYTTRGSCACGFGLGGNGTSARDCMADWRQHVEALVEQGEFKVEELWPGRSRYEVTHERAGLYRVLAEAGYSSDAGVMERLEQLAVGERAVLDPGSMRSFTHLRVTRVLAPARAADDLTGGAG